MSESEKSCTKFSIFKVIFGGMLRDTSNYDGVVKKLECNFIIF